MGLNSAPLTQMVQAFAHYNANIYVAHVYEATNRRIKIL